MARTSKEQKRSKHKLLPGGLKCFIPRVHLQNCSYTYISTWYDNRESHKGPENFKFQVKIQPRLLKIFKEDQ